MRTVRPRVARTHTSFSLRSVPSAPPLPKRGHAQPHIPPVVSTHQTVYGDVTHVQLPRASYLAALALGYHHLGDFLCTRMGVVPAQRSGSHIGKPTCSTISCWLRSTWGPCQW